MTADPAQAGRAKFDIGDIVRAHRAELEVQHPLTRGQRRVLTDIAQCRTAALGGHVDFCASCGYEHPSYNSCRNRHCPKCQALAQEKWIAQRQERLLDVGHFHVVFTLPSQLRPLAQLAPEAVFNALFRAVAEALLELGQSRLGAMLGATLVLHTWTRRLTFHPHVHAIVTAGGLARDGTRFCHSNRRYLFPVKKVMSPVFRSKFLTLLSEAHAAGAFAHVDGFRDPSAYGRLVAKVGKLRWNVHAKAPLASVSHVVAYLGRYTHRVGIANSRLLDVTDERVVFSTRKGTETLHPVDFLWRFVQHVLPDGFHKIRHVGLYASPKLGAARERLGMAPPAPKPRLSWEQKLLELTGRDVRRCPVCQAPLLRKTLLPAPRAPPYARAA